MSTADDARTPRAPLTRDRVVRTAVELADEHGIDGLSMRKLAGHLGFEAMSLYNHVRNKDDLVEGMLDLVCAEVAPPPEGADWKAGLRHVAISTHGMLLRHRWAGPVWPSRFPGPVRWELSETILRLLTAGGFTDHLRDLGFHAITLHVNGFTQQQLSYATDDQRSIAAYARVQRELSPDRFPLMLDHIDYHRRMDEIPGDRPDEFEFVLDLILDGLERLRDRAPGGRRRTPH